MTKLNNPMDILKILEKSNCRKCGEGTCLAFAAKVFKGEKELGQCPRIEPDMLAKFSGQVVHQFSNDQALRQEVADLKKKVSAIDLEASAQRVKGHYARGKLTIRILGKNFSVDRQGNITSDIHVHPWVSIPILSYLVDCRDVPLSNQWVPLRELKNGRPMAPLFERRSEGPLREMADLSADFLEDIIDIFNGEKVENHLDSDISVVLHPLPLVPVMISYWKAEDGISSSLGIFFDATAEEHLNINSIYAMTAGLIMMFRKISITHGLIK